MSTKRVADFISFDSASVITAMLLLCMCVSCVVPQSRSDRFSRATQASDDYASGKITYEEMEQQFNEAGCRPIAPPVLHNANTFGPIRPKTINYGASCR